jgi:ClpP class serine protease
MVIAETLAAAWSFITNIWVLLFILIILIPVLQRFLLNRARKRILQRISRERKSQVITLIHRQETIAFLGIPISRYIDIDDSEEVMRAIRMTPHDTPIDLIMHTPGGIALAATQIALALKAHPAPKRVIVPHYAMSGGTLIALAADEILMDPHAVLGPVDPQLSEGMAAYPASSVIRVLERKPIERINDRTIILADEAKKAQAQMIELVKEILKGKCGEDHLGFVIEELVSGKYTHDYPIFPGKAKELMGDCVKVGIPESVYDLMDFYKVELGARKPGVEYVPVAPPEREQRR